MKTTFDRKRFSLNSSIFLAILIASSFVCFGQPQGDFVPSVGETSNFILQPDGRIIVSGLANGPGHINRLLWNGNDDPSFNVLANLTFRALPPAAGRQSDRDGNRWAGHDSKAERGRVARRFVRFTGNKGAVILL